MSQVETIQKKKLLTFEEICPEWSNHITKVGCKYLTFPKNRFTGLDGKFYDISCTNCCIVGESWSKIGQPYFTGICETCTNFSLNQFMFCDDDELFEYVKRDFVNHFNEVHIK